MTQAQETHYRKLVDLEKTLKLMERVARNERINIDQFTTIYNTIVERGVGHRCNMKNVGNVQTTSWLGWMAYDDSYGLRIAYTDYDGARWVILKYNDENRLIRL